MSAENSELFDLLNKEGQLIDIAYKNTLASFDLIKKVTSELLNEYLADHQEASRPVTFIREESGEFELQLRFAGDVLVFSMHTNIFEFSRQHEVMSTQYIRDDKSRSYCGIINIYNFLSDSFKYNRVNDIGYLIGRIFINKDRCYFIEGKREIGLLYNSFGKEVFDGKAARKLVESAIMYSINFDLLTPPFEAVKEITLAEIKSMTDSATLKTGKRLGFKFQADKE